MDPITALSVASSVVQFVDFGFNILSKAREFHRDGSAVEHRDLLRVAEDNKSHTTKLHTELSNIPARALSEEDKALQELCQGCLGVAKDLTDALGKLVLKGNQSKWKSFRAAFKATWGKERLAELKARLELYNQQIDRGVLVSIRAQVDIVSSEQQTEFKKLDTATQTVINRLKKVDMTVRDSIAQVRESEDVVITIVKDSVQSNLAEHERTRDELSDAIAAEQKQATVEIKEEVSRAHDETITHLSKMAELNRQEQTETRLEMERIRAEAEEQVKQLTEEIHILKLEIADSVKQVVDSVGKFSAKKQKKLRERSNAKFNLWVAKEIILKKLLDFLSLFKFSFLEGWASSIDVKSWKLDAYPKPNSVELADRSPRRQEEGEDRTTRIGPALASGYGNLPIYKRMDLRYPIIAGNVAMVKFCLENGSDASAPLRASVNDDHQGWQNQFILTQASPLLTAIMSQSSGPAQKAQLIHLLLKHGAKPEWLDSTLSLAFPYAVVDGDVQGMTEFVEALMNLYKRCGSSKTLELHSDVLNSLALFSHVLNDDATSIETRLGAYHFSNTVRYRVNQDQYGTTLLYVAARFRKYKAASKLLYMGADPFRLSQCNAVGTLPAKLSSPALTAILQGDLVMLELLLSNVRPESEALVVPSDDYLDDILLLVAYEEDLSFSKRHAIAESYGGRVSKPRNKHRLSSQVHLSATQKQILDIIVRAVGISRVERIKRWDVCLREEIASYKLQALPKVVSKVYQKEAISRPLAVEAPKSYLEILTAEMGSLIGNNSSADRKVDESP